MEQIQKFIGHSDSVFAVRISPNGETLASGSRDGTLIVWRTDSVEPQYRIPIGGHVVAVSFSSDGSLLAAGNAKGKIVVISPNDAKKICSLQSPPLESLAFRPGSHELFVGEAGGRISCFEIPKTKRASWSLQLSSKQILSIRFSGDGEILTFSGGDGNLGILDYRSQEKLHEFQLDGIGPTIYQAVLSEDKQFCFASLHYELVGFNGIAKRYELLVWDVKNEAMPDDSHSLVGHLSWIGGLDYANRRQILASGSFDETVRLWDPSLNLQIAESKTHTGAVYGVCFSPDEKLLASCSADRTVQLQSVESLVQPARPRDGATLEQALSHLSEPDVPGRSGKVAFARDVIERMRSLGSDSAIDRELYALFSSFSPFALHGAATEILRAISNRIEQEYRAMNRKEAQFFHHLQLHVVHIMEDLTRSLVSGLARTPDTEAIAPEIEAPNVPPNAATRPVVNQNEVSAGEDLKTIVENLIQSPSGRNSELSRAAQTNYSTEEVAAAMSVVQDWFEVSLAGGRTAGVREAAKLIATIARNRHLDEILCKALSIQGVMHSLDDDFSAAVPFFEEAVVLARKRNVPLDVSACLGDLANAYRNVGRLPEARGLYHEALEHLPKDTSKHVIRIKINHLSNLAMLYGDLGDFTAQSRYLLDARTEARSIQSAALLANIANNLGGVYQSLGDYAGALDSFREALSEASVTENNRLRLSALGNIGKALVKLGRPAEAMPYLEETIKTADELHEPAVKVNALLDLTRVQAKIGTYLEARRTIGQAVGLARQLPLPHVLQSALSQWASLAEEMGQDTNAAVEALEEAARVAEHLRQQLQNAQEGPEVQWRLGGIYSHLVRLYMSMGKTVAAFGAAEKGRAAVLRRRIETRLPVGSSRNSDLPSLLATLRRVGKHAVLASYTLVQDVLHVFVLRADDGEIRCQTKNIEPAQLAAAREDFRREVVEYAQRGNVGEQWLRISDVLIEPLSGYLKDDDVLIVVTDQSLRGLPVHAMRIAEQRVIERWPVVYLPAAYSLGSLLTDGAVPRSKTIIGIYFTEEATEVAKILETDVTFAGDVLSKKAFADLCRGAELVHVSSYGFFSAKRPTASGLFLRRSEGLDRYLLARNKEGFERTQSDLFVTMYGNDSENESIFSPVDAEKLGLDSRLVTLSSCESGLVLPDVANDPTGLLPSLLVGGAKGVLASLWLVDPEVTKQWMCAFYRTLQGAATWSGIPQAVRAASLEVMASHPEPYFWAAFTLMGGLAISTAGEEVLEHAGTPG